MTWLISIPPKTKNCNTVLKYNCYGSEFLSVDSSALTWFFNFTLDGWAGQPLSIICPFKINMEAVEEKKNLKTPPNPGPFSWHFVHFSFSSNYSNSGNVSSINPSFQIVFGIMSPVVYRTKPHISWAEPEQLSLLSQPLWPCCVFLSVILKMSSWR